MKITVKACWLCGSKPVLASSSNGSFLYCPNASCSNERSTRKPTSLEAIEEWDSSYTIQTFEIEVPEDKPQ